MNKVFPIWPKIILLLIVLAAGWFLFVSKKMKKLPEEEFSNSAGPAHFEEKLTGSVLEYGSNPEGDIDKLLVASNGGSIWLHFPPHAAMMVTKVAPIHALIEAIADQGGPGRPPYPGPEVAVFELKQLQNQSTKAEVNLTEIPPPTPRPGIETEITGNTIQAISSENNNTFSLSGKIIALPPHIARELFPVIHQAKLIIVKGKMRDTTAGFVSASGKPVIKATSIQLDSVVYKVR